VASGRSTLGKACGLSLSIGNELTPASQRLPLTSHVSQLAMAYNPANVSACGVTAFCQLTIYTRAAIGGINIHSGWSTFPLPFPLPYPFPFLSLSLSVWGCVTEGFWRPVNSRLIQKL